MKISDWAFQWKYRFNTDPDNQAQYIILVEKLTELVIPRYVLMKT